MFHASVASPLCTWAPGVESRCFHRSIGALYALEREASSEAHSGTTMLEIPSERPSVVRGIEAHLNPTVRARGPGRLTPPGRMCRSDNKE